MQHHTVQKRTRGGASARGGQGQTKGLFSQSMIMNQGPTTVAVPKRPGRRLAAGNVVSQEKATRVAQNNSIHNNKLVIVDNHTQQVCVPGMPWGLSVESR